MVAPQGVFAERPLLGWPGIVMRMTVQRGKFTVTCANENTGVAKFLYEGVKFDKAADCYKHPFVTHFVEVTELTDELSAVA